MEMSKKVHINIRSKMSHFLTTDKIGNSSFGFPNYLINT